jgi:hypothetical protein
VFKQFHLFGAPYLIAKKAGPQREDQAQAFDEGQPNENGHAQPVDGSHFPAKYMAGKATQEYEQENRNVDAQKIHQQASQRNRTDNAERDAEVELLHLHRFGPA